MQLILGHFFQKPLVMYGWTELCPFRRAMQSACSVWPQITHTILC